MKSETKPLYSVGEKVIFTSKKNPHLNGEYTIRAIHKNDDRYIDRLTKAPTTVRLNHVAFAYRFSEVVPAANGMELIVAEFQLKKKHTPATVSFKRLMELV
jgi:hypothetical protein